MSSLYIDRNNIDLKYDNKTLVVYENNNLLTRIPLGAINRIFIYGDININSKLINQLADNKIGMVFIGGRSREPKMFFNSPHNDAKIRINQYRCSLDDSFCIEFGQRLIQDKINAQLNLLQCYDVINPTRQESQAIIIERLRNYLTRVTKFTSKDAILGGEGAASNQFFAGMRNILPPEIKFSSRNRRPPKDPVNSLLSLGYTLLHYEAVLEIYARGLDPFIGFLHQLDFARESLACDMIEPLRYIIEELAIKLVIEKKFTEELFYYEANGACLMSKLARQIFYKEYTLIQEKIRFKLSEQLSLTVNIIKSRVFV